MTATLLPSPPSRRTGPAAPPLISAVGYLRRSTDRQEQSIPDQRKAVEAYALDHGMQLGHCYVDDAISGTSTIGRKAFQQMIADAQRPDRPFSAVVVYDVKRFGRVDNDEAGYWRHLLKAAGVIVHYATENFAGDGTDDLLRPVKQWQARQESKDLSKVTIRGLLTRSTTGCWMGGAPPYGYDLRYESQAGQFLLRVRYEPDGSRLALDEQGNISRTLERGASLAVTRKDRCWLVPRQDDRVEVVKKIFTWYGQGLGFKAIAGRLNSDGVPSARGAAWASRCSGKWSLTTVRAILVNPAYRGDGVWNKRTDARFHRISGGHAVERSVAGRRLEPNAEADWIVVADAHEALVPRKLWEACQRKLAGRIESASQRGINPRTSPRGGWNGPRAKFLLSGLITCGRCGGRYEGISQRLKSKDFEGIKNKNYFYACGKAIRLGPGVCSFGQVGREVLERVVVQAVLAQYQEYLGTKGLKRLHSTIVNTLGRERKQALATKETLTRKIERLEVKAQNLLDNLTSVNRSFINSRLEGLGSEKEALENHLINAQRLAVSDKQISETAGEGHAFIAQLPELLASEEPHIRQASLRRCVRQIRLDAECKSATIEFFVVPATVGLELLAVKPVVVLLGDA